MNIKTFNKGIFVGLLLGFSLMVVLDIYFPAKTTWDRADLVANECICYEDNTCYCAGSDPAPVVVDECNDEQGCTCYQR